MTQKQLLFLRKKAQTLKSKFQIGKQFVSDASLANLKNGLRAQELIKVRLLKPAQSVDRAFILDLAASLNATIIQEIGHQIVLYRPNPDRRKIILPS